MKKHTREDFMSYMSAAELAEIEYLEQGIQAPCPGLLSAMRNFFDAYKVDLNIAEFLRKQSAEYCASNIELAHQVSELEERNEHLLEGAGILERKVAELTKELQAYRNRVNDLQMSRPGQVDPYTVPEDPDAWRKVREVPEGWSALAKDVLIMEGDIWNGRESWEDTKEEGGMVLYPDMYYRRDDRS